MPTSYVLKTTSFFCLNNKLHSFWTFNTSNVSTFVYWFGYLGDSDLQNLLGNMSQQQLMQLLGKTKSFSSFRFTDLLEKL